MKILFQTVFSDWDSGFRFAQGCLNGLILGVGFLVVLGAAFLLIVLEILR